MRSASIASRPLPAMSSSLRPCSSASARPGTAGCRRLRARASAASSPWPSPRCESAIASRRGRRAAARTSMIVVLGVHAAHELEHGLAALGARREHEQHRRRIGRAHQVGEQRRRVAIDPLHVVEERARRCGDRRAAATSRAAPRTRGFGAPAGRRSTRIARRIRDRRHAIEHREQRRQQARVARQQRLRLVARDGAPPIAELVDRRDRSPCTARPRARGSGRAAAARSGCVARTRSRNSLDQRRLAHARRRAHARATDARPRVERLERGLERRELGVAAGESAVARDADRRHADAARLSSTPSRRSKRVAARTIGRVALEQLRAQLVEILRDVVHELRRRAARSRSASSNSTRIGAPSNGSGRSAPGTARRRRAYQSAAGGQRDVAGALLGRHVRRRCRRSAVGAAAGARARRRGRSRAARRGRRS